jgi:hypothetical protein
MNRTTYISPFEAERRARRTGGWKFWIIAILLHLLFIVGATHFVIQFVNPPTGLRSRNFGVEVAQPLAPPVPADKEAIIQPQIQEHQQADFNKLPPILAAIEPSLPVPLAQMQLAPIVDALPAPNVAVQVPREWARRQDQRKDIAIAEAGGDPEIVEAAVLKALRWLKANQNANGSWSSNNQVAMTGLALLAFLAHGETHQSKEFGDTVLRAMNWLADQAEKGNGQMGSRFEYETGIATYAMAEAYGMTGFPRLAPLLEQCVDVIIKGQTDGGGWIYNYKTQDRFGDISISGWQVQALKTAYLAGIKRKEIPPVLNAAMQYVKNVYSPNLQEFGYRGPGGGWQRTGIGVLCLQFWNEGNSDIARDALAHIRNDIVFLLGKTDDDVRAAQQAGKRGGTNNLYGYYYITQAMFLHDAPRGPYWRYWNEQFVKPLVKTQHENGSFTIGDYTRDPVYSTSLSVLMLTVYYRNQPALGSLRR